VNGLSTTQHRSNGAPQPKTSQADRRPTLIYERHAGRSGWDESVEVGGFGGDEERIAFQSMWATSSTSKCSMNGSAAYSSGARGTTDQEVEWLGSPPGMAPELWRTSPHHQCASRFLRKWPAATVDSEPPEALWPAVKGQAGSLARVRGHPLHRAGDHAEGRPSVVGPPGH
jgi:hypothetical protein